MKLPEYKNNGPLYSKPEDPLESNKFVAMFFGYPLAFIACVVILLLALAG